MNISMSSFRSPATHAAQRLHRELEEIAACVRDLQSQPNPSPPQTEAGAENNPRADADPSLPVARTTVSSAATAPAANAPANPVRQENAAPRSLPIVPDLGPELAALTGAIRQQHEASTQTLRQLIGLCQLQSGQIERLNQEVGQLASRMRVMASRQ